MDFYYICLLLDQKWAAFISHHSVFLLPLFLRKFVLILFLEATEQELLCIRSTHPFHCMKNRISMQIWLKMNESHNFPFYLCNSLEIICTEGCMYPSTVWECHPRRYDSRFGNIVNANYLVNPSAHCNNCSFLSYKHTASRSETI